VRVEQPGTRRGPSSEARTLYANLSAPLDAEALLAAVVAEQGDMDDDLDGDDDQEA
jgi:hypothetical protein